MNYTESTTNKTIDNDVLSDEITKEPNDNASSTTMKKQCVTNPTLRLKADRKMSQKVYAHIGAGRTMQQEGGLPSTSASEGATVIKANGLYENDKSTIFQDHRNKVSNKSGLSDESEARNNVNASMDRPQDLRPIEEYLRAMNRILDSGKLPPRKVQMLKEVMSRYEPCQEHKSIACNSSACRLSRLSEHSQSLSKTDEENDRRKRHSLIDSEMIRATTANTSRSVDDEEGTDEGMRETENVSYSTTRAVDFHTEDRGETRSDAEVSFASRIPKISLDVMRENEADVEQIQSGAESGFVSLLKDTCNLEALMIDNPFSDFSLRNKELWNIDEALRKHIDFKRILEQSRPPSGESEPTTSKGIIRSPDKQNEKSVRFANESTKDVMDVPLFEKEIGIPKKETIQNQKICKCQ